MSDSCTLFGKPECDACQPRLPSTPVPLVNRPGLHQLRYRIGTFPLFRQAMLDALTIKPVMSPDPVDAKGILTLTSRSSDDYAVALLELWAYVCDVLTFYQQSIANETFLRSAVLRESVTRIAFLLGYEPFRGVAASLVLAFTADRGVTVQVPAGLKTQSIPPPGDDPQIFETSEPVTISERTNQLTLVGRPTNAKFTTQGEIAAADYDSAIVPGVKLLFFHLQPAPVLVQEQVVTAVLSSPVGKVIQWRGNVNTDVSTITVRRLGRKFRAFGVNAPVRFLAPNGKDVKDADFKLDSTKSALVLDNVYDSIAPGARVLLYSSEQGGTALFPTVTAVSQGQDTISATDGTPGPLSGVGTLLTFDTNLPAVDRRTLVIYELIGNDIPFRKNINPDQVNPATDPDHGTTLYVTDASGVAPGTRLLLLGPSLISDLVTVKQAPTRDDSGVYKLSVAPPIANAYVPSTTTLYANVADATNGETQVEQVLGDGDSSQSSQEFVISIAPVTYIPDPASDTGATSTLRVFVGEVEWKEVDSFYGHGPDEHIYVTRQDEQGKIHVRFGDGVQGSRLPTGTRNIHATLRKGLGAAGNVVASIVTVLLQQWPGVKKVVNPLPAVGGAGSEPLDALRQNAPASVATLGRAVSLEDYQALALTYRGIGKARADWADFNSQRGVALTVVTSGGASLDQLLAPLREFLDQHRDPNIPLSIQAAVKVKFRFAATVHVSQGNKQSVVKRQVEAAFGPAAPAGFLGFDHLQLGVSVHQSALIAALQEVSGTEWVELQEFSTSDPARQFGVDPHKLEAVYVGPGEIGCPSFDGSDAPSVDIHYQDGIADLEATP